jgi:hypothetical protein
MSGKCCACQCAGRYCVGKWGQVLGTRKTEFSMDFGRNLEGIRDFDENGRKVVASNPNSIDGIEGIDATSRDMANVNNTGNR